MPVHSPTTLGLCCHICLSRSLSILTLLFSPMLTVLNLSSTFSTHFNLTTWSFPLFRHDSLQTWTHRSHFFLLLLLNTSACPYVCVPVHVWWYVQKKKLSNHVPETTTTQAVPSLSRGRTCKKKNFQTTTQSVPSLSKTTTGFGHCVYL